MIVAVFRRRLKEGKTFDDFLAKDGLLAETEDAAVKQIIADRIKVGDKCRRTEENR